MTFTKRLQRVKKAAVMTGLAVLGVVATPVKAQTAETVPEKAAVTATTESADTQKKKQFEAAVRAGAPKEEIAKYMDFPGFIPVTKDGKFDEKKATDWAEKLAPYAKILAEKGDKLTPKAVYGIIREATGREDISFKEFEQVTQMAKEALETHKLKWPTVALGGTIVLGTGLFALALFGGAVAMGSGSILSFKDNKKDSLKFLTGAVLSTVFATGLSSMSLTYGAATVNAFRDTPERSITRLYSSIYDSYVDNTIKAQQKQFQQMEWNQAKQALSPQK